MAIWEMAICTSTLLRPKAGILAGNRSESLKDAIYIALDKIGGSISAEHGIGQMKVEQLQKVKDPIALEMMAQLKKVFDPKGLLNPGKVVK